jgi:hypothetical protein
MCAAVPNTPFKSTNIKMLNISSMFAVSIAAVHLRKRDW